MIQNQKTVMKLGQIPAMPSTKPSVSKESTVSPGPKLPSGNAMLCKGERTKLKIIFSNAPLRATPASGLADERGDLREELMPFEASIPGLSGEFFAFKVAGDSMFPSFEDGDLILCEQLSDKDQLNEEDAYVLQSRNGLYLKRVLKKYDPQNQLVGLVLSSDNQEGDGYPAFSLPLEDLENCLRVKMRLTGGDASISH